MLSERTRNTIVGLTILGSLAVAVVGIAKLGKLPEFFSHKTYVVRLNAPNSGSVGTGTKVTLQGYTIGTVQAVEIVENPLAGKPDADPVMANLPSLYARLTLGIEPWAKIPKGTVAKVGGGGIGLGGAMVDLVAPSTAFTEYLPQDGNAAITTLDADTGLIPKGVLTDVHRLTDHLTELSGELTTVARDLHVMLVYTPLDSGDKSPGAETRRAPENISTLVLKLNKTVDQINLALGDPKLPAQVKQIMANVADASEQLKGVLKNVDTVVANADKMLDKATTAVGSINTAATRATSTLDVAQEQIVKVADKLAVSLHTLNTTMESIANGEGTTGKLIKDAKLYDGLVDLTRSLATTTEELNKLIHQWKQDGVPLKLK